MGGRRHGTHRDRPLASAVALTAVLLVEAGARYSGDHSELFEPFMGEVAPQGVARFGGRDIAGLPGHRIARLGLGHAPENAPRPREDIRREWLEM